MKTTGGQIDLSGETFGTLEVLRPVRLRPRISYEIKCTECGSVFAGLGNQELTNNPKCINNARHGKPVFRSWKEEYEHEQDETFRKVEEDYKKASNELAKVRKEAVLKIVDDEYMLSREVRDQAFTPEIPTLDDAIAFTQRETAAFLENTPGYFPCPENFKNLTDYCVRNGANRYIDRDSLQRAYYRLREVGAIVDRPAPPPPPEPEPVVEPEIKKPVDTKSLPVKGIDPQSGKEKFYTQREVDRMSSEEYRRAFFGTCDGLSRAALDLVPLLQGRLRA